MTNLLNIPENVMILELFPFLDHNDLLRLRHVSKQTKTLAGHYLRIPQPGHQGNWELKIDSSEGNQTLHAFLQLDPEEHVQPPPSRLYIANGAENGPSEPRSIFKDEHLKEFMDNFGKYIRTLRMDKLFYPFTSLKELGFYESLVNLEEIHCGEMITVGGAAQFEKTENPERRFLLRPILKKLTVLKLESTDCMDPMWTLINGVSNNLVELLHPFQRGNGNGIERSLRRSDFAHVRQIIERRGMKRYQRKLLYDWRHLLDTDPLELVRAFASCRKNGVMIKNLDARYLHYLLCDENGRMESRDAAFNPKTWEWNWQCQRNYERNQFVGSVIHSLTGVDESVFLMDLPNLEEICVARSDRLILTRLRPVCRHSRWPNLRKIKFELDHCAKGHVDFIWGQIRRPKLEELSLVGSSWWTIAPDPRYFENCANLKKMTISGISLNFEFFLRLWKAVPLLEDLCLIKCEKLTHNGLTGSHKKRPAFLKLTKLKHLSLQNLDKMNGVTDKVFVDVFRHLKLTSFKLSSDGPNKMITFAGIKELFTGSFAETIKKLDLNELQLEGVSEEELKQVASLCPSSNMM